jgi:hypothetical protein
MPRVAQVWARWQLSRVEAAYPKLGAEVNDLRLPAEIIHVVRQTLRPT